MKQSSASRKNSLQIKRNLSSRPPAGLGFCHIRVIGEAANGISVEFQEQHHGIPWKDIIAMRHFLVHQYFGIDLDEVWSTAQQDLPQLMQQISLILKRG
ncbi:MAG: hypothetical protein CVV30_04670 [Methanomicrobiales archaeon HGW-Methanomicrobiales-1]|jgi:uncharacterized protein with HEPN domain|nr:MAG: hypothetical protein CVV30_04670 [Methanomicrobiales archaeon HGW-Methanomicrobiales-1]